MTELISKLSGKDIVVVVIGVSFFLVEAIKLFFDKKSVFEIFFDSLFRVIKYLFQEMVGDVVQKLNVLLGISLFLGVVISLFMYFSKSSIDSLVAFFACIVGLFCSLRVCESFTRARY